MASIRNPHLAAGYGVALSATVLSRSDQCAPSRRCGPAFRSSGTAPTSGYSAGAAKSDTCQPAT